ncbi:MAG: hypothetical protein A3G32_09230 [Deltaproteobacteria bacterium RIFCSPLOWO2_12_FULL_40_28]|nr:MAG: hypothetical protein A3C45_08085 [Deltaproteobacteria bacterium RIFCSPHIGHO2_02_FULL_40_28]OGQ21203.1 MAG: hypothetical protein A3E27_01720 [Deltaproteobacteria bacterium RIFCSPHIGHO2_12_FULL_40_32]OGQ39104.1 MAG: hypothetical protein A3I69_09355 [Deltaproteobacteria bacterium RIFCSPLOWO2_02_FULL_40_36]OGQ53177.1 MAG: hypothetical protein A3G32_09230 [Deltaproteobacteria bacterium RIFCSPLOWO2_12_FULL_40_28]
MRNRGLSDEPSGRGVPQGRKKYSPLATYTKAVVESHPPISYGVYMFNMGSGELILIGLIAILLVPPDKLPEVAIKFGRFFAQLKQGWRQVEDGLKSGLNEVKSSATLDLLDEEKKCEPKPKQPE